MILYMPKEFYASKDGKIIEHYTIEYDKNGFPNKMTVFDKGEEKVVKCRTSRLADCTHISFGKKFFMFDEYGNIMKHSMFKDFNYCNDNDVRAGTVEYHYNTYEHSVTKLIKSYNVNLQKFITENPDTIREYVGRYQLCGVPQTRPAKKLVITNGKDGDSVVNTIKLMFGVYDSITYYRYNNNPRRVIVRKTVTDETVIVNNTIAELDDMGIMDNYQNVFMSKPDGSNERYIVFEDDDFDKAIKNIITYNNQGHYIVNMGYKDMMVGNDLMHCKVYSVLQQIDFNFYNSVIIDETLDLSMIDTL